MRFYSPYDEERRRRMTEEEREIQDAYRDLNDEQLLIDRLMAKCDISTDEYISRLNRVIAGRRLLISREYDLYRANYQYLTNVVEVIREKDYSCWQKEGF